MCDQLHSPTVTLWKRSLGTHRKEGWVGPEDGLSVLEKRYILALAGIELRFLGRLPRNCIPPSASVQTRVPEYSTIDRVRPLRYVWEIYLDVYIACKNLFLLKAHPWIRFFIFRILDIGSRRN